MADTKIVIDNVSKIYKGAKSEVRALDGVSLSIGRGELVAIVGRSGSGKTTLMNILGCIDTPTRGVYELFGYDVGSFDHDSLARLRNREIAFVFQAFNLVPTLSALENVALPLYYRGVGRRQRNDAAMQALAQVGLSDRASHRPSELSGGQQQRIAVARAIAAEPQVLLADEPTGNLDSGSGERILALLHRQVREGRTVIIITHDMGIARRCGRIITISDGKIISDERNAAGDDRQAGGRV